MTIEEGLDRLIAGDTDIDRIMTPHKQSVATQIGRYVAEIELFNAAYGLVKVKDRDELIVKHILDSLSPLGHLARLLDSVATGGTAAGSAAAPKLADVGTGPGLPGIPLAIALSGAYPAARVTLIERMGRRVGFLHNCQAVLSLPNVSIEEKEMEKAAPARFDVVVFRAFRPLDKAIYQGLRRLCKAEGRLFAYKGKRSAIDAEMAALEAALGTKLDWQALPCAVPGLDEERHVVVL
jgi:16S rRNA (guanine527-N7)-methyltransferase